MDGSAEVGSAVGGCWFGIVQWWQFGINDGRARIRQAPIGQTSEQWSHNHFLAVAGHFLEEVLRSSFFFSVNFCLTGVVLPFFTGVVFLLALPMGDLPSGRWLNPQTFFTVFVSWLTSSCPLYLLTTGVAFCLFPIMFLRSSLLGRREDISSQLLAMYHSSRMRQKPSSLRPWIQGICARISLSGYLIGRSWVTSAYRMLSMDSILAQTSQQKASLLMVQLMGAFSKRATSFLMRLISSMVFSMPRFCSSSSCSAWSLGGSAMSSRSSVPTSLWFLALLPSFSRMSYFSIFLSSFMYWALVTFSFLTHMCALAEVMRPIEKLATSEKFISFLFILSSCYFRKQRQSSSRFQWPQTPSSGISSSSSLAFILLQFFTVYPAMSLLGMPISLKQSRVRLLLPLTIELSTKSMAKLGSGSSMQQLNFPNSSWKPPSLQISSRVLSLRSSRIQFLVPALARWLPSSSLSRRFMQSFLVISANLYFSRCGRSKLVSSSQP